MGIWLCLFIAVASILWAKSFKSVACCYVGLFFFCHNFSGLDLFYFSLFCRQIAIHVQVLVFLYHRILRARGPRHFQTVLLRLPALHYVGGQRGEMGIIHLLEICLLVAEG